MKKWWHTRISMIKTASRKMKVMWLLLIVAVGIGGWFAYQHFFVKKVPAFQTQRVVSQDLVKALTLSGQVERSNLISVYTKASGVVSQVYVKDGQKVKAGDKLAMITLDSQGQNNQAQAWSQYLSAKKSVEQSQASQLSSQAGMFTDWDAYMKKVNETNFTDPNSDFRNLPEFQEKQKEWQAAEINFKSQATAIASAQASQSQAWYNYRLYQATIVAPIDGVVVGLNLAPGLTVSYSEGSSGNTTTQTVATIKTTGKPVLSFAVTELDIPQLKVDQAVTVTFDSLAGETFAGKIAAVDRVGTTTSSVTQYTVLVVLDQDDDRVLTNMATTAELVLDKKEAVLVVPVTAVVKGRGGQQMVRVLKNGRVTPTPVETGLETDTSIEITSGLNEGDVVVTGVRNTTGASATTRTQGNAGFGLFGGGGGFAGGANRARTTTGTGARTFGTNSTR